MILNLLKENENLKNEIKSINNEFSDYKIKNSNVSVLKQQVVLYETKLDEIVNEKVIEKESEMKNIIDEKIMLFKEREHFLQRQVNQLKDQLMALQDNHDNTQAKIIDHSQKYEEEVAGKLAELEIITNDLENANMNVAKLQQENENLRQQLSKLINEMSNDNNAENNEKIITNEFSFNTNTGNTEEELVNLKKKCQTQDEEINQLIRSVERQKNITEKNELIFNSRISDLEAQLSEANESISKYKEKLETYSDYKKIKEELEVLKSIEFSATSEFNNAQQTNSEQVSLEKLIMAKNKKLQAELTEKRMEVEQLTNSLNETTKSLENTNSKIKEQENLISKLEEDLLKVNAFQSSSSQIQLINSENTIENNLRSVNNNNNSHIKDQDTNANNTNANANDENNSDSIIAILTSQRNRYRQRNQELEQQIRSINDKTKDVELEVQSLKNDNIKLYEKIRYLQSFNKSSPYNSYEQSYNRNKKDHLVDMSSQSYNTQENDISEKYKVMYEDSLNPFNEFRGREESRKYRSLNAVEKVSLNIAKLFLANKYSRIFFLSYIVGLHFLVFVIIFKSIDLSEIDMHSSPLDVNNNRLY